ncbi:MAG: GGDEF domain-containing protein [Chloroflexi bacterium]|nr:GGDEF domain-containing protein [Chloroflexota bacterium]
MLFRRTRAEAPPAKDTAGDDGEAALDTVAALLRAFGRYAFDIDAIDAATVHQLSEAWAAHLLVGTSAPNRESAEPEPGRRDWAGVRQFVLEQRQREHQYVPRALGDLRQAVWAFVEGLQRVVGQGQVADRRVGEQIARLREAVNGRSPEEIRRDVLSAVAVLTEAVERRQQQQRAELAALGARLSRLGYELQEARRESVIDPLTQVYNRRAFDDHLRRVVCLRDLFDQPATLLLADADYFKSINDTYGHLVGDAVLQHLANCLVRSFLRRNDFVARFGGEEFAVILPDTPAATAVPMVERFLANVRQLAIPHEEWTIRLTVSVGLAEVSPGETAESWLARTDRALYLAKRRGRDCLVLAPPQTRPS